MSMTGLVNKKKVPDLAKAGDWQQAQIKYPRVLRGLFFRAHQTAQEEQHPLGHLGGEKAFRMMRRRRGWIMLDSFYSAAITAPK